MNRKYFSKIEKYVCLCDIFRARLLIMRIVHTAICTFYGLVLILRLHLHSAPKEPKGLNEF